MSRLVGEAIKKTARVVKRVVKQIPVASEPLEIGSYVSPTKAETAWGEGASMRLAREEGYVGRCVAKGLGAWVVEFPPTALSVSFRANYQENNLRVIPKEEGEATVKRQHEEFKKELIKKLEKIRETVEPKRVPLMDRTDYTFLEKNYLATNTNYLGIKQRGCFKQGEPIDYTKIQIHTGPTCCALTKVNADIVVHVPKEWASYYGYTVVDVKAWIAFLNNCEFGFTGYYNGKIRMNDAHKTITQSLPLYGNNNFYTHEEMEAFEIVLPSTGNHLKNYMSFICVRYLYNQQYCTIPFIAMQIKKGLGDKCTFWEALVLAHLNESYNGYYCLNANALHNNTVALPKPANSAENVTTKLMKSQSMNTSFVYDNIKIIDKLKRFNPQELIRTKNYEGLYEFLQECRLLK